MMMQVTSKFEPALANMFDNVNDPKKADTMKKKLLAEIEYLENRIKVSPFSLCCKLLYICT